MRVCGTNGPSNLTPNQLPNSAESVRARQTRFRGACKSIFFSMRSVLICNLRIAYYSGGFGNATTKLHDCGSRGCATRRRRITRSSAPRLTTGSVRRSLDWSEVRVLTGVLTIRNWSQLPRGVLVGLATIFAAATILYSALWMYVVRQPSTHVDLGFDGQYSAADHCFNVQIIEPGR